MEAGRRHQCETRSASGKRSVRPKSHERDEPPSRPGFGLRFARRQDRRAGGTTNERGTDSMAASESLDAAAKREAEDHAKQGVEQARRAGLNAEPRVCANDSTIAEEILSEADEVGAEVIVLATSRVIGLEGLTLGSVFHSLVRETDRPVLVVPSREQPGATEATSANDGGVLDSMPAVQSKRLKAPRVGRSHHEMKMS
ncbi:hypothetical protein AYO39_02780 [Actinobacteria bacterium SCGC AG-212-D09]|nr:hypothetical protein AYO39_02780 [Actinobacteria bacterium SCGC AG-212-D09]